MERSLGLICGAGVLPARMAEEARRQGWRVVAFAYDEAPGLDAHADVVVPSRITEAAPVLARLQEEEVSAALFSGKFRITDVLVADERQADATAVSFRDHAASRIDSKLTEAVIAALAAIGVAVLDQRPFLPGWLAPEGCWTTRRPSDAEWAEARRGLGVARLVASHGIGQTVVLRHAAITAVEAAEGTTEAIRRGAALGGPGAVIVKCVAPDHDYRVDLPSIGPETIEAAVSGGAAVVAVEAGRVVVIERERCVARADAAGVALVGLGADEVA